MTLFSTQGTSTGQSSTEHFQSTFPDTSSISTDFFTTSPEFKFPPSLPSGHIEVSDTEMRNVEGLGDQAMVGNVSYGDEMGIEWDDPFLHSLQALAETQDFEIVGELLDL
jgi:hypothetical protein